MQSRWLNVVLRIVVVEGGRGVNVVDVQDDDSGSTKAAYPPSHYLIKEIGSALPCKISQFPGVWHSIRGKNRIGPADVRFCGSAFLYGRLVYRGLDHFLAIVQLACLPTSCHRQYTPDSRI